MYISWLRDFEFGDKNYGFLSNQNIVVVDVVVDVVVVVVVVLGAVIHMWSVYSQWLNEMNGMLLGWPRVIFIFHSIRNYAIIVIYYYLNNVENSEKRNEN